MINSPCSSLVLALLCALTLWIAPEAEAQVETPSQAEDYDTFASPADLEYNRAQYEPMIRELWAAQKDFDDLVTEELTRNCGASGRFAVWGQAFVNEARGRIVNDMLPGGDELQGAANRRVEPVRQRLEAALQAKAPAGNGALFQALLTGERVN